MLIVLKKCLRCLLGKEDNIVIHFYKWLIFKRIRERKFVSGYSSPLYVIGYNSYGSYAVPVAASHKPAAQAILRSKVWELETLRYIESIYVNGDIVHAGTFFGDFLPFLNFLVRSKSDTACIWAFEPNPQNLECAKATVVLNDLNRVKLVAGALGSEDLHESVRLVVEDVHGKSLGGQSHVIGKMDAENNGKTIEVPVSTIDDVCKDRGVSVIQLDVEGSETSALVGGMATIQRCKPVIIVEFLPDQAVMQSLAEVAGYKIVGTVCGNSILRPSV